MNFFASHALLPDGWASDVAIDVDDAGTIVAIASGASRGGREVLDGPVVPAMPNVHSHAFQRALAGRTGRVEAGNDDSFWTWRQAMYGFLDRVDADAFEAIAAQAYVEMAKAGYAAVAEFHYVHHDPAGKPYADPAELAWRIVAAARTAGVGLTLLPVFYAHGGFGGAPTTAGQRRFVHTVSTYTHLYDRLREGSTEGAYVLGVAPHSLRAVTPDELGQVVRLAAPTAPIHIHAAEQTREVDDCYAWSGMRPVEWLVAQAHVDARWCLVHATHMTGEEVARLANSGAVTGLAPTTEADLGDGVFAARNYLRRGGAFGIGSDSNTAVDPFAELRLLELTQRLFRLERNVLAGSTLPVGQFLYELAAAGGARALAQPVGVISRGARADLVVLNADDPALVAQPVDDVIDAAIFGPCRQPVRDVMVAGRWVVRDGHHPGERAALAAYRAALARLATA